MPNLALPTRAPIARGLPTLVVGLLIGCGPSFEAIQEGELRFAHCDRLDLDPNIAPSHRLHCWREWRRVYTYGQTRDRVEYAQRRIAEVVSGDPDPPFVLPSGESRAPRPGEPPAPSPLLGPPPPLAPGTVPPEGTERAASSGAATLPPPKLADDMAPPLDPCKPRCEAAVVECSPGCESLPTGCKPCGTTLEACLRECAQERADAVPSPDR